MRLSEEELISALRDEREEVDPGFAAALDEWAAAGFPRAERPGGKPRRASLIDRLRATPPRRLLAPAGAALTLVVVVGVVISQNVNGGVGGDAGTALQAAPDAGSASPPSAAPGSASATEDQALLQKDGAKGAQLSPTAPGRERKVAQDVDLTLASEPEKVREVADGVNEVVNRYRGFVVTSSVQSGDPRQGPAAHFELRLPARNLQAALADLSELSHVQSRTEGTIDVTERFTSAQDRIDEAKTVRRNLLEQIEKATTQQQIDALRANLRNVNAALNAARTDLQQVRQRVQLVPVNVSIVAEEGADSSGDWSIGDAFDDAGKVLSTAAGIAVIAGAVLLPLALVGLIVALALRGWASRSRERALDD